MLTNKLPYWNKAIKNLKHKDRILAKIISNHHKEYLIVKLKDYRSGKIKDHIMNLIAQNLYKKYGFEIANTRKGYYFDNREDAYTMTRNEISIDSDQMILKGLADAHSFKWGKSNRRYY